MGAKVTIDSATLMNKGLEVIEARWLFDVHVDRIDVVVHPQSIVHSCVEFVDGSILAHMGPTDMRIPIQHALFYPTRVQSPVRRLSLADVGQLTFERPDRERFPALELAYEAATTRRDDAGGAERGQRSRGRVVLGGAHWLHGHSACGG